MFGIFFIFFLFCKCKNAKLPALASRASRAKPTTPGPIASTVIHWNVSLKTITAMKYFAQINPAIKVEYNNKVHLMSSTKRYEKLADLFCALALHAEELHGSRVSIFLEKENKTCTPWL